MARVTQAVLHEADPTYMWKLILRSLSIIVAGIAIGLIAWAEIHVVIPDLDTSSVAGDPNNPSSGDVGTNTVYEAYYGNVFGYTPDNYELPWEYISLGLSIVWNIANIGVWFTPTRSGRGMHPGANVGCDLVLFLMLLVTGIFASFAADSYIGQIGFYLDNSIGASGDTVNNNTCPGFASCDALAAYYYALRHKGVVIAVGVAFTFFIMLFHFALFVSACRYTHARRYQHGGRYAKAITDEATVLATKMVRDMGYPPPGPVPMQQQSQPLAETPMAPPPADTDVYEPYRPHDSSVTTEPHSDTSGKGKAPERDLEQGAEAGPSNENTPVIR